MPLRIPRLTPDSLWGLLARTTSTVALLCRALASAGILHLGRSSLRVRTLPAPLLDHRQQSAQVVRAGSPQEAPFCLRLFVEAEVLGKRDSPRLQPGSKGDEGTCRSARRESSVVPCLRAKSINMAETGSHLPTPTCIGLPLLLHRECFAETPYSGPIRGLCLLSETGHVVENCGTGMLGLQKSSRLYASVNCLLYSSRLKHHH